MTATYAEMMTRLKDHVRAVDTVWKAAAENGTNLLGAIDTCVQSAEGTFAGEQLAALKSGRQSASQTIDNLIAGFDPIILDLGETIASPYSSPLAILRDHLRYQNTNSKSFKYRNWTRGSASAGGSNVGTGTVIRNTVDEYDNPLQGGLGYDSDSFVWRLDCTGDARLGFGRGNEQFLVYTTGAKQTDNCVEGDPNGPFTINSVCADDVTLIEGANFASYDSTNGFAGWETTTPPGTGITRRTSSGHRPIRAQSIPLQASDTYSFPRMASGADPMWQYLRGFDPNTPYLIGYWYKHSATLNAGTAKLTVGGVSITKAASTSWTFVRIDETNAEYCWPANWLANDAKIQIERDSESAETMDIGGVICVPYDFVNGAMLKILAGATDFVAGGSSIVGDYFSVTDQTGTPGTTMYWLDRVYGLTQVTASSPSEADYS